MEVKIYSIDGAKWYVKGREKYLTLERYPVYRNVGSLPSPFLPVVDVYKDEVVLDFFGAHILPFHYLRFWGKSSINVFLNRLKQALIYDIANIEGYTLNNIVFSEGNVYILPPRKKGFTLRKVLSDLEYYLKKYAQPFKGYPYNQHPIDPGIAIKKGIYNLQKPFSIGHLFGLMRRLIIWGYYPVLSISPSHFMESSRFLRNLALYMPWQGKTSIYDMVPSLSLIMKYESRISVGMSSIVSRILDSLHAEKVAFITLGMPKVHELYSLTDDRDIIIYTDEEADVSISLSQQWNDTNEPVESSIACFSYTMSTYDDKESWEDTRLLTDIPCKVSSGSNGFPLYHLSASDLFNIWKGTGKQEALVLAVWKDRHNHHLVSRQMYDALVQSSLIKRKGFFNYLVYGALKKGLADLFPMLLTWSGEERGLSLILMLILRIYMGEIPEEEEIQYVFRYLESYPLGRLLWAIIMFVNYISRTKWDRMYEILHKPTMDFMYISPPEGFDKWLFLTAKNAFAISYMYSGNINEAYNILSSIVSDAKRYGYFDILFKVYNNLAILSGEISPRLSSQYLLFATTYALVSSGTSLGGVFASLLTEEVQRANMDVLRRIYEVGWSIPLDDVQEFILLATWIWVLISRGYLRKAERYIRILEKKYSFPTGDIVKDIEYYYLKLLLSMVRGDGKEDIAALELMKRLSEMPLTSYRPDIYRKLALHFYRVGDPDSLKWIKKEISYRYGEDSISYLFTFALYNVVTGNIHSAIDILKDVYRKSLHVWKLLDAAEAAFLIGDLYCRLSKGKIASLYYRKAEVLLTRLGAMNLLRYMLSRYEVCVNIDITSDFYGRMKTFTGDARKLMEEMYSLILDLESENFFLDRILDMFAMVTDFASLDVVLGRMLAEILHILPAEKGYIATVGGDLDVWVSYSLDGRSPPVNEFVLSPEEVVKRGGVFVKSPSAIGDVELIGKEHLVVLLENDTASGVFSDIDEYFLIKLMEIIRVAVLMESLGSISVKDKLTDLYARWYGIKRGIEEFEKAKRGIYPVSVLYMDLDGFKEINDTYGHSIGDKVLTHVGNIIRESVRYMDIPFRYGGDEFIVVLPATSITEAAQVAQRIVDAIFKFFGKYPYKVSTSIGVSSYPEDHVESFEQLMNLADLRLYKAKEKGKNRYDDGRG